VAINCMGKSVSVLPVGVEGNVSSEAIAVCCGLILGRGRRSTSNSI